MSNKAIELNGIDKAVYFDPTKDMVNIDSFTPGYKIDNEIRFFYDEEVFPRWNKSINNDFKYDVIMGNGLVLKENEEVLRELAENEVDGKFPYRVEVASVINNYGAIYFLNSYLTCVFTLYTNKLFTHQSQIRKIRDLKNGALIFLDVDNNLYYYGSNDIYNITGDQYDSGVKKVLAKNVKDFWNTKSTLLYETYDHQYYARGDFTENLFTLGLNYNNVNTDEPLIRLPFNKKIKQIMATSMGYGFLLDDEMFYMTGPNTMLSNTLTVIRQIDENVRQLLCTNGIDIAYIKNEDFTDPTHLGRIYVSNAEIISNYFYSELRGKPFISLK